MLFRMVSANQVIVAFLTLVTLARALGRESRSLDLDASGDSDPSLHSSFVSSNYLSREGSDRSMKLMRSDTRGVALDSELLVTVPCTYKEWTDWQPCSKSCGGGKRVRQKLVTAGDCDTFIEDEACNLGKCQINCTWQEWETWTSCSNQCGPGIISRSRVMDAAEDGGAPCSGPGTQAFACVGANCTNGSSITSANNNSFGNSAQGGVLNSGTSTTTTSIVTATTTSGGLATNITGSSIVTATTTSGGLATKITGNLILTTSNVASSQNQESLTRALIFAIANLSSVNPNAVTVGTTNADLNVNVWFSISLASLQGTNPEVINGVAASIALEINSRQQTYVAKVVQDQLEAQQLQLLVTSASLEANVMHLHVSSVPAATPAPAATPGTVGSSASSTSISRRRSEVAVAAPPQDEENPSPTPAPPRIAQRSTCARSSKTGFILLVGTIVGTTSSW